MSTQTRNDTTPGSMLEIYMHALANKTGDAFLDSINMGVGYYGEEEYWQQMRSFKKGLYADAAMTRKIIERAKLETKRALVQTIMEVPDSDLLNGVDYADPEGPECHCEDRYEYFEEHSEDIWQNLGDSHEDYSPEEHRAWLVSTCTGLDPNWTPPHWRMLKARHEASKSKGARALDNLFGRPPENDGMAAAPAGGGMEEFQ